MKYESSHLWLQFRYDYRQIPPHVWTIIGECASKIDHIIHTPLNAEIRKLMHDVCLIKGAQATTAIEGNTLSEEQIRSILEHKSTVPPSFKYQEREVGNILRLFGDVSAHMVLAQSSRISHSNVCEWNRRILEGAETEGVPGRIREVEVGVSNYLGAPAQDCEWLLNRLCTWNNELQTGHEKELKLDVTSNAILRAIIMHLYFVWIHPFQDGNGRTARLFEFAILLGSGVPTPAAHLLSNFYNRTRDMYYRRLDDASKLHNGLPLFIEYAVTGLRDQLVDQLDLYIYPQLWHLTLQDQIAVMFRKETGKTADRRRLLIETMTGDNALLWKPVAMSELRRISVDVGVKYADISDSTLRRDVLWLVEQKLLTVTGDQVAVALGSVVEKLPDRRIERA